VARPPHTMQLAGRADRALMIAIHDALRRDLDHLLHATASHASARARWASFRSQLRFHLAAALRPHHPAAMKNTRPRQPVTSNDPPNGPLMAVSPAAHMALMPGRFTESALWALVIRHAQCSDGRLDPDQWFPVSADPGQAATRQPRRSLSARPAQCAATAWRYGCSTGTSAGTVVWGGLVRRRPSATAPPGARRPDSRPWDHRRPG